MRLIEVDLPETARDEMTAILASLSIHNTTSSLTDEGRLVYRLLVKASDSGAVLDTLEQRLGIFEGFRAIVLRVEASVPRVGNSEPEAGAEVETAASPALRFGVSREELYARIVGGTEVSTTYLATVALSTIVAAIGLWRNDLAVIIGAMVIAPLLGPNVALALATTLADHSLARKALKANLIGVTLAMAISVAVGLLFVVDPSVDSIASRTQIGPGDIVIALAAGSAGALAYTTSAPAALIGVMVAVALLPPLVTFGLLAASGHVGGAVGAAMLVLANVISVNLAGVLTFLWQGVRPRNWWEAEKARESTRRAIVAWVILLAVLVLLMSFAAGNR